MALVLARASTMSVAGDHAAQSLADVFCTASRLRLGDLRRRLAAARGGPDFAAVSHAWTTGTDLDSLLRIKGSHA
jgi:hypothetical protein